MNVLIVILIIALNVTMQENVFNVDLDINLMEMEDANQDLILILNEKKLIDLTKI